MPRIKGGREAVMKLLVGTGRVDVDAKDNDNRTLSFFRRKWTLRRD